MSHSVEWHMIADVLVVQDVGVEGALDVEGTLGTLDDVEGTLDVEVPLAHRPPALAEPVPPAR